MDRNLSQKFLTSVNRSRIPLPPVPTSAVKPCKKEGTKSKETGKQERQMRQK